MTGSRGLDRQQALRQPGDNGAVQSSDVLSPQGRPCRGTQLRHRTVADSVLLGTGITYALAAGQYRVGRLSSPGPAFYPLIVAVAIIIAAGILLIADVLRMRVSAKSECSPGGGEAGVAILVGVALAGYCFLLFLVGFVISSWLLSVVLMLLMGEKLGRELILLATITCAGVYGLFSWLNVPLYRGLVWGALGM